MKSTKGLSLFIIPSLIGIILFMIPLPYDGGFTIPVAILSNELGALLGNSVPTIMTWLIIITAILTIVFTIKVKADPNAFEQYPFFKGLFAVNLVWVITRIIGAIFAAMTLWQIGPKEITGEYTGGLLLYELLPILFTVFLFAGLFLPLLLNFGLLELFGTLLSKFMRPIFKLPGRSSIDALASWLGDGTIGVLLTSKQYQEGFYTKREAAVIGTTFSVVSITFTIVILEKVELSSYFFSFYGTIVLAGVVAAIIMPRIPPLSTKANTYVTEVDSDGKEEDIPEGKGRFAHGIELAVERAEKNTSVREFLKDGGKNILDMWMGVAPVVMAFGTIAVVIAETTPVFTYLGMPFVPLLELLQVPEANKAAETVVIGFADMFLPAILISEVQSELTRFIVAALSVTQLIYMSEVGGLLLGSKIPVNFKDLVLIFLLRTLITLPIIVGMAHLIF
ncbi:YjiH family protein [Mangrovibacillus cuniculi]|uniref:YjiH family protein n=1 Tax=Mangrovibacillus cuniculi TaxID=2593652 RepID=A0A7S8HGP4_9BACI|nr:YjiH family protein [Mangrovibacillus cuniculi]QPC47781.1 YjiH family protein [Mangrovibacillus cuniculi]